MIVLRSREGLEETLTVVRLKLPDRLRRLLATINPIEPAFHTTRMLSNRVKRWRDGDMNLRWCTAGLLRAEQRLRRIKGYRELPQLTAALNATPASQRHVGDIITNPQNRPASPTNIGTSPSRASPSQKA